MNKRQRFEAAVNGGDIDYPPCTVWVHFVTDALPGEEAARRHATYVRTYDWDMCKVMHDYRYPLPAGLETLTSPGTCSKFEKLPGTIPNYAEQLKLIRALRQDFGPDMPIVDTFFDPFQQVMRKAGFSSAALVYGNKKEALHMLDAVTDTVCDYMQELKRAGCDAVLYSINGAIAPPGDRGYRRGNVQDFPAAVRFARLRGDAGHDAHPARARHARRHAARARLSGRSVQRIDRLAGNPSLADLRKMTGKCLMGGINEQKIPERSLPEIRAEMQDAVKQAGKRNFMLTPGCTSAPQTPEHILRCVRETSRAFARS
jgi:uroporphyrinogen decarboxylase